MWALMDLSAAEARNPRPPRPPGDVTPVRAASTGRGSATTPTSAARPSRARSPAARPAATPWSAIRAATAHASIRRTTRSTVALAAWSVSASGSSVQGSVVPEGDDELRWRMRLPRGRPQQLRLCGHGAAGQWCNGGDCAVRSDRRSATGHAWTSRRTRTTAGRAATDVPAARAPTGRATVPRARRTVTALASTQTDQNNCGGCGNVCPAGQDCVDGACQSPRCAAPTTDCGGVWCCNPGQLCVNNEYTGAPAAARPGSGVRGLRPPRGSR